uniref:Uncharacterized protein n=1 Tax=Panthera leo TaxID=9689 RepID=A0A8C8WI75_PANLE
MRGILIQTLLYGSLTFGIWTALLYVFINHNHVSNLDKRTQEPASIWSLEQKFHRQVTHGSEEIPRPYVRFESPDEEETKPQKSFFKLSVFKNVTQPTYLLPALSSASTTRSLTPCFGPCSVS